MTDHPGHRELSPAAKRALLARLLQERAAPRPAACPLSPGQAALWFLHRVAPDDAAYHIAFPATIHSPLDVAALDRAWGRLVIRHEILRTTFAPTGDSGEALVQRVHDNGMVSVDIVDASRLSAAELHAQVVAAYRAPFDLERGPVARMAVFTKSPTEHIVLVTIHHIACDAWSTGILVNELLALYTAESTGQPATLPPPPPLYTEFVQWQAQLLAGPEGSRHRDYWERQLAGAPAFLDLPAARPRGVGTRRRGATHHLRLSAALTAALRERARTEGVTLYTVLLAAFQTLLHRQTGQATILIGSPTAGRSLPSFEGIVGYFVNTVVLRADFAAECTFGEHLRRTRDTVNDALRHADYPFPLLVRRLQSDRAPGRSPVFQVLFNLLKLDRLGTVAGLLGGNGGRARVAGLEIEPYPLDHLEGQFELALELIETPTVLLGTLKYDAGLYDGDRIARLAADLETLLRVASDGVEWPVATAAKGAPTVMPTELLTRLRDLDVRVWVEGDRLRVSAPKGVLSDPLRAEIADHKTEIMRLLVQAPLAFSQQRLWFMDQLRPGSAEYNLAGAVRLVGALDVGALERSLAEIVRRHQSLRTVFASIDGAPIQVIVPDADTSLPVRDLGDVPAAEREARAQRIAREEASRPFDLARGPLFRAMLVRLGEREHLLSLVVHHIVSDGWSSGIFVRELAALYEAFAVGKPSPLADLPIQYADFARSQQQWLQGEALAAGLAFWKRELEGTTAPLELATDRPRPAIQTFNGSLHTVKLPPAMTDALNDLSRREGATLFMTLLGAFNTLLHRYSGHEDIVVGTPIANRTRVETEGLIGFFANTLVVRTDVSGGPTFRQLLQRVRDRALAAYAHQDVPFEKLVEALQPVRDLSRSPLFQVMFILLNFPRRTLQLPGMVLQPVQLPTGAARTDLTLTVAEETDGLELEFEYNTDLFDRATIEALAGHLSTLLAGVIDDPDRPLGALPMLSPEEQRRVLVEWNATDAEIPDATGVHELVARQAARRPDAVAAVFDEASLSYRTLDGAASRLASCLRTRGVRPGVVVGLCVDRSLDMLVALLGILKAGGAYLPLDPAYPAERLAFMMEDSGCPVLVTQEHLRHLVPAAASVVTLEGAGGTPAADLAASGPAASADDLAYVLYTSGSTGRPKGVQIPHRALINLLASMSRRPGLNEDDVFLAVTTLSFDIAGLELYLPLMVGARLVVASRETAFDGPRLIRLLESEGVTAMQATPATWRLLLDAGWRAPAKFKVFCGGEALTRELADRLLDTGASVWNLYGPTETTIWSTVHEVQAGSGPVPIGRPIANTRLYVLDAQGGPVPVGVPGELYIGGCGVATGYLNRSGLTAERFIPDRFQPRPGGRLYRTGDLVRSRADGTVEFLGRIDDQVKIRGFRVELGEIETILGRHPAIAQAVVAAPPDQSGTRRLAGYLVLAGATTPSAGELRAFVGTHLPDYMVPSTFTVLPSLPLTPNGKVDRRRLPAPEARRSDLATTFEPARNDVERTVSSVWRTVLSVPEVGVNDNFFDLGGHSLLIVQVHSKLRSVIDHDLSIVEMFQYPTVRSLSSRLARRSALQPETAAR